MREAFRSADSHSPGSREEVLARRLKTLQNYKVKRSSIQQHPDLIFVNGSVLTVEPEAAGAEGVAVSGDRIAAVGSSIELMRLRGPETRVIDLGGRTLIPGLNSTHRRQMTAAKEIDHVSLIQAKNFQQLGSLVGARAACTPPGQWIESRSLWHEALLAEKRLPTRRELDPATPNHPLFMPRGIHAAVVNSRALEAAGIDRNTPNPEGGTIERDANGDPTGVLLGRARELVAPFLPVPKSPQDALSRQMAVFNSYGITAVTDSGLSIDDIGIYLDLLEHQGLTVRSHLLQQVYDWEGLRASTDALNAHSGNSFLRFDGFKFSLGGGGEDPGLEDHFQIEQNAASKSEILLPPGGIDELLKMCVVAAGAGFQFQSHAAGDTGAHLIANIYEQTNRQTPLMALRWAAVLLSPPSGEVIQRFTDLGVTTVVEDYRLLPRATPLSQEVDHGYGLSVSVAPGAGTGRLSPDQFEHSLVPFSPFTHMEWMATRRDRSGVAVPWPRSRHEALRANTYGNTVTQFMEQPLGSILPGKLADLAVLSGDPTTADGYGDLRCDFTVVGGRIVYER
ncbi:amidohydrolase [Paenarthrobacter sp. NPDC058040]|uniref:amidohydrolase n=1 Tax=unclassified Paenarthrobacter TaxID=2634190 RepID=UPI0036DBC1A3